MDRFKKAVTPEQLDALQNLEDEKTISNAVSAVALTCDPHLNDLEIAVIIGSLKKKAPPPTVKKLEIVTICSGGNSDVKISVPKKFIRKSATLQDFLEDAGEEETLSICEVTQECLNVVKHYLIGSYTLERIAELSKTNKEIEEVFRYLDISINDMNRLEVKIDEMIKEFQSSRISEISISKISANNWGLFMAQFDVKEKNMKLEKSSPPHPKSSSGHDLGYVWDMVKTEVKQMDKVMEWLNSILDLPLDSELKPIDVSGNKTLFIMPSNIQVKLKGTTDIVFVDQATVDLGKNYAAGIKICIEVKKEVKDSHLLQAKGQLFACDMVSYYEPLVFLTDLQKDWTVLFFQSSNLVVSQISFQTAIDTIKAACITKKKKGAFKWDIGKEVKPTRFFDAKKFSKGGQDVADLSSLLDSLPEEDQMEVKQELFWKAALATPSLAALSYYS